MTLVLFGALAPLSSGCLNQLSTERGYDKLAEDSEPDTDDSSTPDTSGGTTVHVPFDVFAPFAQAIVATDGDKRTSLVKDGQGVWRGSLDLPQLTPYWLELTDTNGNIIERKDTRAAKVEHSVGRSLAVDMHADAAATHMKPPWERVVYEMHIGTFNDAEGGAPGTFASAVEQLDHIVELGANTLLVMPIAEFAADFSWGYNPALPYAIESVYGGPEGFAAFVDEAHTRGLAVMVDVVYNHFGPSDLDLWQFDGWSENDKGGVYFYQDDRSTTPWGDTRPDYGRDEVRRYMIDNALSYFDRYGIDGLRFDSTINIRKEASGFGPEIPDGKRFLQDITSTVKYRFSDSYIIAEDLQNDNSLTTSKDQGGMGFDGQWDAHFVHPIREALTLQNDSDRNMGAVIDALATHGQSPWQRVIYTESHDEVANGKSRLPEQIWPGDAASFPSRARSLLGAMLVLTSPGTPMLLQGQEFLEDGWFTDTDPLDWNKKDTHNGIFNAYKDLVALRTNKQNTTAGLMGENVNFYHNNDNDNIIAYHRYMFGGVNDDVLVVANFADRSYDSYDVGAVCGRYLVRFELNSNDHSFVDAPRTGMSITTDNADRDGMPCTLTLPLRSYDGVILSRVE